MKKRLLQMLISAGIADHLSLVNFNWEGLNQKFVTESIVDELRMKRLTFDFICALSDSSRVVTELCLFLHLPSFLSVEFISGIPGGFYLYRIDARTGEKNSVTISRENGRVLIFGCNLESTIEFDFARTLLHSIGMRCNDALALVSGQEEYPTSIMAGCRMHALTTLKEIEIFSNPIPVKGMYDFAHHHDVVK